MRDFPLSFIHISFYLYLWIYIIFIHRLIKYYYHYLLCICLQTGFHIIGQEFGVLLPQPPEHWDYRYVPPCLAVFYTQFSSKLAS